MSSSTMQEYISKLLSGLKNRNIDFIVSDATLNYQLTEIYITEAQELILFPPKQIDSATLQWILEIRTPLKVRLTFFSQDVARFKVQLMRAISVVQDNGLEIPNIHHVISVQELSDDNIRRLLESLENWAILKENGRPLPSLHAPLASPKAVGDPLHNKLEDFHVHLRGAIKSYWTERYFARYMNTPIENVKKVAEKIGIQRETCGRETLYFFEREKALSTYYSHIIKGILAELNLQYRETLTHEYYIPNLKLGILFFEGEIDQLRILAGEYANNHDLMIVVPEQLRRNIGRIQDDFFQILPLDQDKIRNSLIRIVRQRVDYIPAYSSGLM